MAKYFRTMKNGSVDYDGDYIYGRASRWIKIRHDVVTPRHCLYDYAEGDFCDDMGDNLRVLDHFKYNKRDYALGQFLRLAGGPLELEDGSLISGYDSANWYNTLFIEIDPCGEYIRLYEEDRVCEEVN